MLPKNVTGPIALAVEVLSPSTRRKDQVLKRSKYEEAGVRSYWIVDPDGPTLAAFDLVEGRYVQVAHADGEGAVTLEHPFPVTIVASRLRG